MKESDKSFSQKVGISWLITAIVIAFLLLIWFAFHIILVIFAGILFAVLLSGAADWVNQKTRLPRGLSLASVVLSILLLFTGFGWLIGPQVASQFSDLREALPAGLEAAEEWLGEWSWGEQLLDETPDASEIIQDRGVMNRVTGFFLAAFDAVVYFVLLLFIGLYGAIRPSLYVDNGVRLIPFSYRERAREILGSVARSIRYWFGGQFISMIIVGTITTIGLMLLGMPMALALGIMTGLFEFVPYLGPILAAVPIILIALLQGPEMALYVTIFFIAVQQFESYLITPMVQQIAVSMPPALLIVGQIVFGFAGGLAGVMLATPLLLVVIVLVQMLYVEDVLGDEVTPLGPKSKSDNSKESKRE